MRLRTALFCLTLGAAGAFAGLAAAQLIPQPGPPIVLGCAFNTSPPTVATGNAVWLQCDNSGQVKITGTVTATSSPSVGITPTDRTITSASGASQQIMAANAARHSMLFVNTGNANCGVNPTGGTAAIGGAGTLTLGPLGSYYAPLPSLSAVTVICTAGQPVYANEN